MATENGVSSIYPCNQKAPPSDSVPFQAIWGFECLKKAPVTSAPDTVVLAEVVKVCIYLSDQFGLYPFCEQHAAFNFRPPTFGE